MNQDESVNQAEPEKDVEAWPVLGRMPISPELDARIQSIQRRRGMQNRRDVIRLLLDQGCEVEEARMRLAQPALAQAA